MLDEMSVGRAEMVAAAAAAAAARFVARKELVSLAQNLSDVNLMVETWDPERPGSSWLVQSH